MPTPSYVLRLQYVDHDDETMLIQTNKDAPMFKLIRVSLKDGSVKELVPENPRHKLNWATVVANSRLVISYIEDVKVCTKLTYKCKTNYQCSKLFDCFYMLQ